MNAAPAPRRLAFPLHPIPARASARPAIVVPDYLPARMLNEFAYCPRLFFYEWVEGVFARSGDTVEGTLRHERVDARAEPLPAADADEVDAGETVTARSVTLSSETHKLIATIETKEFQEHLVEWHTGPLDAAVKKRHYNASLEAEDAEAIVTEHLLGGRPVERLRLDDACVNTKSCPHKA